MLDFKRSHLINELIKNRKLKIAFMSHNAHWPYIEQLADHYENCDVKTFGNGTSYIKMEQFIRNQDCIEDCDLIIYYSSGNFDQYEFLEMQKMVTINSNSNSKRITIGYAYHMPREKRTSKWVEYGIQIVSIKENNQTNQQLFNVENLTPLELTEITLSFHDELEKQNIKVKK